MILEPGPARNKCLSGQSLAGFEIVWHLQRDLQKRRVISRLYLPHMKKSVGRRGWHGGELWQLPRSRISSSRSP